MEHTIPMPCIEDRLIACHECDLLHEIIPIPDGSTARCLRCGATLYRERRQGITRALAYSLTATLLFIIVNVYPLLGLKLGGQEQYYTLLSGALELGRFHMWEMAVLVLLTSVVFPFLNFFGMLYVLVPLSFGRRPWRLSDAFKLVQLMMPWGMIGVYMLGVLVAIVKLADLATVVPGVSLYSLAVLIFVAAAAEDALDPRQVWRRVEGGP